MNNQELEEQVVKLLKTDSRLTGMWAQEPSAMHIPFKKSRQSFFVLVSLCLNAKAVNVSDITYACLSTLRLLVNARVLDGVPAVEIVPYAIEGAKTTRLLRLSVEAAGIQKAIRLSDEDLLGNGIMDGIRCEWCIPKPGS